MSNFVSHDVSMRVVFRCDASLEIGTGHLRRCLLLAKALKSRGHECVFLTNANAIQFVPDLNTSGFEYTDENTILSNANLIITDHYALPDAYYDEVQDLKIPHMIIDDIRERDFYDCHYLLINNLAYDRHDYKGKVRSETIIFDGPEALLLNPEFINQGLNIQERPQIPENFLFFFGGTDPHQLTHRFLKIIDQHKIKIPHIVVVIGGGNEQGAEISALCKKLNAELHVETSKMAELIRRADVAIGAGGTTIWEKMVLKLPSIEFSHSKCQEDTLQKLHSKKYILYAGDYQKINDTEIAALIGNTLVNGLDIRYCDFVKDNIMSLADNLTAELNKG